MEQNSGSQNKIQEFVKKYPFYIIIGAIILTFGVYLLADDGQDNNDQGNQDQAGDQANSGDINGDGTQSNTNDNPTPTPTPTGTTAGESTTGSGNVTARGTLRVSDNAARGNLMVESPSGKIYVSTKRNFSDLVGQDVTLNAEGSLSNFVFLGLNNSSGTVATGTDTEARGGAGNESAVNFSGQLRTSDNAGRGNYMVVSGSTKVYLKTVRDYAALTDSDVILTADGSLQSFTNARVVKK